MSEKNINITYIKSILWTLVIIWMAIIFILSAQTAAESSSLSGHTIRAVAAVVWPGFDELPYIHQKQIVAGLQSVVRDAAHLLTYLVLGMLTMAALLPRPWQMKTKVTSTLAICTLYAVTDELHQVFVNGRAFQLIDIGLDICGVAAGAAVMVSIIKWAERRKIAAGSES